MDDPHAGHFVPGRQAVVQGCLGPRRPWQRALGRLDLCTAVGDQDRQRSDHERAAPKRDDAFAVHCVTLLGNRSAVVSAIDCRASAGITTPVTRGLPTMYLAA